MIKLFAMLLWLIPSITLAQSFFMPPTQSTTATSPSLSSSQPVLSPAEFNSQVSQITAKKQAGFKEQLEQQLAQQPLPSTPASSIPSSIATPSTTTPSAGTATTTTTSTTTINRPSPTAAPTPPPAPPKDVYTGFGGGDHPQQPAPAKQPDNTGGWNIRY